MKNLKTGRYLFALAVSGLLLNFGCSKDATETKDVAARTDVMEQRPEEIQVEILLKDERKRASVDKSAEEAPALSSVAPAQQNCANQGLAPGGNPQWPGAQGAHPGAGWGANANMAPGFAPAVVDDCAPGIGGYPGPGLPGPGPLLPHPGLGFPGAPFISPYTPYFVADIIESDDDTFLISDDDSFTNDDDSNNDEDSNESDDDI